MVLDMPGDTMVWFELQNTAITRIDFHPDYQRFVYANRVDFLPRHLLT